MFHSNREAAAWLGGIIDGEGTIVHHGGNREISVVNTDGDLLFGVYEACDQLGYDYRVYERSERRRYGKRPIWEVHISRRETLEKLAREVVLRSGKRERLAEMVESYPKRPPIKRVLQLYADGLSINQVAKRLGVGPSSVQYWLAAHDVERRSGGRDALPVPDPEVLREASERLGSLSAMAREFGCSTGTVSKWVNAAALSRPAGRPHGAKWSAEERARRGGHPTFGAHACGVDGCRKMVKPPHRTCPVHG